MHVLTIDKHISIILINTADIIHKYYVLYATFNLTKNYNLK